MEELTMTYEQAVAFLKKYMEENGRKQVEVAAELGVSGGLVSSFLAGTYKNAPRHHPEGTGAGKDP